jgi:hypothetical protein
VVSELGYFLNNRLDDHSERIFQLLLKLAGNSKKIVCQSMVESLKSFTAHVNFNPKFITALVGMINEKNINIRRATLIALKLILERTGNDPVIMKTLKAGYIEHLGEVILRGISDSDAENRKIAREAYYHYNTLWPSEGENLLNKMDTSTKKIIVKMDAPINYSIEQPKSSGKGRMEITRDRKSLANSQSTDTLVENHDVPTALPVNVSLADILEENVPSKNPVDNAEHNAAAATGVLSTDTDQNTRTENEKDVFSQICDKLIRKDEDCMVEMLTYLYEEFTNKDEMVPEQQAQKIRNLLFDLISQPISSELKRQIVGFDSFTLLADCKVYSFEDCFIPFLNVYMENVSEEIQIELDKFLFQIRSSLGSLELIPLLIESTSKVSPRSPKKSPTTKLVEKQIMQFLIEWIKTLFGTEISNAEEYLAADSNFRFLLNRMVPVALQYQEVAESAGSILKFAYSIAPEKFLNILATFDSDVNLKIKEICEIVDQEVIEPEEGEFVMEEDFEAIEEGEILQTDDPEPEDFMNESMPLEFQDASFSSTKSKDTIQYEYGSPGLRLENSSGGFYESNQNDDTPTKNSSMAAYENGMEIIIRNYTQAAEV